MLLGRRSKVDSRVLMDRLAAGRKPRAIATEFDCSYSTIRRRLSRYVRTAGFATVEQAVAHHIAARIKAALPLALRPVVDRLMRKP